FLLRRRLRGLLARSRLSGGVLDGFDDVDVPGAAAEIPRDRAPDVALARIGIGFQERVARHHHAGGAIAALQAVLLKETLLDGIELAFLLEAFDSCDVAAVCLNGEHRAGFDRHSVEEHGTGAAMRRVAADVRASEPQVLSQKVNEKQSRLDLALARGAV